MGLTPERVVAEAAELVDRTGYAGLSLAALADRLGVRVPSLYKHIEGIEDLRRRLAGLAVAELSERVEEAVAGLVARDALLAAAVAHREYASSHPGRFEAIVAMSRPGAGESRVDDILRRTVTECGVPPSSVRATTLAVRSLLRGFAGLAATGVMDDGEPDADAVFRAVLDLLDRGLAASA